MILELIKSWGQTWLPRSHRIEQGIRTCLSFHVEGMLFGVDVRAVQKIERYRLLAQPRGLPHCLCGLYRHEGMMIPVLDVARRFGHPPLVPGARTCIVIVELGLGRWRNEVGLLVDEVCGMSEFASIDLKPMPELMHRVLGADRVEGVAWLGKDYLVVLDHLRLLDDEESSEVAAYLRQL